MFFINQNRILNMTSPLNTTNKCSKGTSLICVLLIFSILLNSKPLIAHGFVVNSRADYCTELSGLNENCGAVSGLPQYILGVGRFPISGPVDGQLASAEISQFSELDLQNQTRWYKNDITTGPIEFIWGINISHPTTDFRYYITKSNWNPNAPLTRSSFNLTPFCIIPVNLDELPNVVRHNCNVPNDYFGYHVIYATWDTTNEELGFYQVLDVNISENLDLIFQNGFE